MASRTKSSRLSTSEKAISLTKAVAEQGKNVLLDTVLSLYEECSKEATRDKNAARFVEQNNTLISELKCLQLSLSDFKACAMIGRGTFGEVRIVREIKTGCVFALKSTNKTDALHQYHCLSLHEEKEILARNKSPFLVQLHCAFQDATYLHLVMEFAPGGDLLSRLNSLESGGLPEEDVRFYMSEVIAGVDAVHQLGFVHRDIKPENMLLSATGHIKLADFGCAAKLDENGVVSQNASSGTPDYMAPEVLACMELPTNPDASSYTKPYGVECDWWSTGISMFELMVGRTPRSLNEDSISNINNFGKVIASAYELNLHHVFEHIDIKLSDSAKSLLCGLVCPSEQRLGLSDIVAHEFFSTVIWDVLETAKAPFVPHLTTPTDTSYFDQIDDLAQASLPPPTPPPNHRTGIQTDDLPFAGFSSFPAVPRIFTEHTSKLTPVSGSRGPMSMRRTSTPTSLRTYSPIGAGPLQVPSATGNTLSSVTASMTSSIISLTSRGRKRSHVMVDMDYNEDGDDDVMEGLAEAEAAGSCNHRPPLVSVTSAAADSSLLKSKVIDLKSDVAGKDDMIQSLKAQLEEYRQQLQDSKQKQNEAERTAEEHRISRELAVAKLNEMTEQLSTLSNENKCLTKEITLFLDSKREWDKEKQAGLEQTTMELSVVQSMAERERINGQKRLAFKDNELKEAKHANDELRRRIASMERRLQTKSTEALSGLEEVKKRLLDVSMASKDRITSLQTDLNTVSESRNTLQEELGRLQDAKQSVEDEKRELDLHHQREKEQLCDTITKVQANSTKLESQVAELTKLTQVSEDHSRQVSKLEELLLGKAQCCADLMMRVTTLGDELEQIQGDKQAMESAKWALEEENKKLEAKLAEYRNLVVVAPTSSASADSTQTDFVSSVSIVASSEPRLSSTSSQTAMTSVLLDDEEHKLVSSIASEVSQKQKELFMQQEESLASLKTMYQQLVKRLDEHSDNSVSQQEATKMSFHLELRQQLAEAQQKLGASEEHRRNLEKEMDRLAKDLRIAQRQHKVDKSDWTAAEEKLRLRVDYLRSELRSTRETTRVLRRELSEAVSKQQTASNTLDELKLESSTSTGELRSKLSDSQSSCRKLTEALETAKARLAELEQAESKLDRMVIEMKLLQSSKQVLTEQVNHLDTARQELVGVKARAQAKIEEQQQQLEAADLTIRLLKETTSTLETQTEDWEVLHDEIIEREKKLQKSLESVRSELLSSEESLGEAQSMLSSERDQHSHTKAELATSKNAEKAADAMIKKLETELKATTKKLSQATQKCTILDREKAILVTRIEDQVSRNRAAEDEMFKVQRVLSIEKATVTKLQAEIAKLKSEISQLTEVRGQLVKDLDGHVLEEVRMKEISHQQLKLINFLQDQNDTAAAAIKAVNKTPIKRPRVDANLPAFNPFSGMKRTESSSVTAAHTATTTASTAAPMETEPFIVADGPSKISGNASTAVIATAALAKPDAEQKEKEPPATKRKKPSVPKLLGSIRMRKEKVSVPAIRHDPPRSQSNSSYTSDKSTEGSGSPTLVSQASFSEGGIASTPKASPSMDGFLEIANDRLGKSWTSRFTILTPTHLKFYHTEIDITAGLPSDSFPLFIKHGKLISAQFKRNVFSPELPSLSVQDRQLCFSLTITSPNDGNIHTMFKCPDRRIKTRWARAIQLVLSATPSRDQLLDVEDTREAISNCRLDMLCSVQRPPGFKDMIEAVRLSDKNWLIATRTGLSMFSPATPSSSITDPPTGDTARQLLQVPTSFSEVHQLARSSYSDNIAMIIGKERQVHLCRVHDIVSVSLALRSAAANDEATPQPATAQLHTVTTTLQGCKNLAVEKVQSRTLLAVTSATGVNVYCVDQSMNIRKDGGVSGSIAPETISSLLFTSQSLFVVGMDLHVAPLSTFIPSEFIRDSARTPAMLKQQPRRVFCVSALYEEDEDEFVVCYDRFAVFLSGNGHTSRTHQLEWNQVATHFAVCGSTLLVGQTNSVKYYNLHSSKSGSLDLPSPQFLSSGQYSSTARSDTACPLLLLSHRAKDERLFTLTAQRAGSNISSGMAVASPVISGHTRASADAGIRAVAAAAGTGTDSLQQRPSGAQRRSAAGEIQRSQTSPRRRPAAVDSERMLRKSPSSRSYGRAPATTTAATATTATATPLAARKSNGGNSAGTTTARGGEKDKPMLRTSRSNTLLSRSSTRLFKRSKVPAAASDHATGTLATTPSARRRH